MIQKYYFIAALGQVNGIKDDLLSFSSNQPKYIDSKNVLLCTFASMITIDEMKLLIDKTEGRVYFISEVNDSTFTYYMANPTHQEALFGDIIKESQYEDIEFEDMYKKIEIKEELPMSVLDLIDKGYDNLTEEEKEFLNKNR